MSPQPTSRRPLLAAGALACAAALALWLWSRPPGEPGVPAPTRAETAPGAGATGAPVPTQRADEADLSIRSGATLALDAASLPRDGPLVLDLVLGEPDPGDEPMPVRVIAPDRSLLHLGGDVVGPDRLSARVQIDPEWLAPGRYIIEVRTGEKTHFPLRRYALEIR